MKSLNVKKLVAVGVAAAIAATPVAFAAQTFNTTALPTAKDWYLNSVVVVGHASAPSDAVWAGNIAAAIANMAYTEEQKEVSVDIEDAEVKLKVPGEIIVPGEGYTLDDQPLDYTSNEYGAQDFTQARIPTLANGDEIELRYKTSDWEDATAVVYEKIHVNQLDVERYVSDNKSDLRFVVPDNSVYYQLDIKGLSIPLASGTTYSKDGDTLENFKFTLLGKSFEITKIARSSSNVGTIELVASTEEVTLEPGQEYDIGSGYKVKVHGIAGEDSPYVSLYLVDDQGNVVDSAILKEGESTDFGGKLEDRIRAVEIFPGDNGYVKLALKSEVLTLTGGTLSAGSTALVGSKTDFLGAEGWTIEGYITLDSSNNLTGVAFKVIYEDSDHDEAEDGLSAGEPFAFPGEAKYGILFAGLTPLAPYKEFKIDGDELYVGAANKQYIPVKVYAEATLDATNLDDKISGLVNDKDVYIKYNTSDGKVYVDYDYDGEHFLPETSTAAALTWTELNTDDDPAYDHVVAEATIPVSIDGDSTADVTYKAFLVAEDDGSGNPTGDIHVFMYFDQGATAYSEDTPYTVDSDAAVNTDNNVFSITKYTVTVGSTVSDTIEIPIETKDYTVVDGNKMDIIVEKFDKFDFKESSWTITMDSGAVQYLDTDADTEDYPDAGITEYGAEIELTGSNDAVIKVPQDVRYVKFFVGKLPETIETTGEMTAKKGDTVKIGDTEVTIEDIVAPEAKATYTEVKPIDLGRLVYLDNEVPSGKNLIVVGGYYVNSIAAAIAEEHPEIKDAVAAEGDYIVDKYTYNGKDAILVFGYTADDTAKAAQEFLNWLKQNVQ